VNGYNFKSETSERQCNFSNTGRLLKNTFRTIRGRASKRKEARPSPNSWWPCWDRPIRDRMLFILWSPPDSEPWTHNARTFFLRAGSRTWTLCQRSSQLLRGARNYRVSDRIRRLPPTSPQSAMRATARDSE